MAVFNSGMLAIGSSYLAHLTRWCALGGLVLALSGCGEDPDSIVMPPRPVAQTQTELDFVRRTFNIVQSPSIRQDIEYCGYIGISDSGRYLATEPAPGKSDECWAEWPQTEGFTVLASYHTHAAWSEDYDSEVPSYDDMVADLRERVDGYVATPGGRLWYVDSAEKTAWQVCGRNCLISDPSYQPDPYDPIRPSYTLEDLRRR